MKIYIKYMVSLRCKMFVRNELQKLGVDPVSVELGVVDLQDNITEEQLEQFKESLKAGRLELLDDKKNILVERIKNTIIEMVHFDDDSPKVNDSEYISEKLGYDYTYLSNTFSEVKGITIQQYIIKHKVERVKELLLYNELTLTEIAWKLNYSSVAHLSNQFKKVTGLTPTYFKEMKSKREKNLENL
jgi:AraC-like DNA-binding protein